MSDEHKPQAWWAVGSVSYNLDKQCGEMRVESAHESADAGRKHIFETLEQRLPHGLPELHMFPKPIALDRSAVETIEIRQRSEPAFESLMKAVELAKKEAQLKAELEASLDKERTVDGGQQEKITEHMRAMADWERQRLERAERLGLDQEPKGPAKVYSLDNYRTPPDPGDRELE